MKKRLISIAISIVVFAALLGLIAPVQAGMYTVQGYVYDTNGVTPVDGVDVTVTDTNTGDSLSDTTKWGGFYSVVFGWPATADVTAGDTLELVATYGTLTNTTTVTATGVSPQIVDLILQVPAPEPPEIVTYTISNYVITPSAPTTEIDVAFSEPVEAWIKIEDLNRNLVNELYHNLSVTNPNPQTWDGTNTTGVQVPDGDYYVNVTGISTELWVVNNTQRITVDKTAPTVTPVSPQDEDTDVPVAITISATFSEAMDSETITTTTFTLVGVSGDVEYVSGTKTATFDPTTNLEYSTTYMAIITTGVKDSAGISLAEECNWTFTTESAPTYRRGGGGGAPRDSDGDGYTDIQEMIAGTDKDDPCDPNPECAACSKPAATPTPTAAPTPTVTPTPTIPPVVTTPTPTPTPTPTEEPGFEAVFAIAGLLAVAYLVLRRKSK